ncbi:MAG TPA: AsmA family protein [Rhabdochlamydiaceae bacterium]|jgi:uncharacterized protein involved in outer membrane biogenesis
MKSALSAIASLCIALILILGVIVLLGWKRASDLAANELSKKLKVNVAIGGISGDINTIIVDNIEIDNPEGSHLPQAFICDKMTITAAASQYLQQDVVIDSIVLDGVYVDLEFDSKRGKQGNWSTIMNNAYNASIELKNEKSGKVPTDDAVRTVLVRHLILTNISTDLVYRNKNTVEHLPSLDEIILKDLRSEGGSVRNQLVRLILSQTLKAVYEEQEIKHDLPGGRLRYLLPLRRLD